MEPLPRRPDVKAIAHHLSVLDEKAADALLTNSGTRKLTPGGWPNLARQERKDLMQEKLRQVAPDALRQLTSLITPVLPRAGRDVEVALRVRMGDADRRSATQAITDFFVDLREDEADELLRRAGASSTPLDWDQGTLPFRRALLSDSLNREEVSTIASLAAMVGYEDSQLAGEASQPEPASTVDENGPIFVVHGHAITIRHEVVRVLERGTGREVIVLHEQPNSGRTILEKFEAHAAGASYAVVLLMADDEGGTASTTVRSPRGRQNVIFELGFFFGKLGRARVAVLLAPGVEKPSDVDGLVYIGIDEAGAWKQALTRELASAKIEVDYSRIP